jgi:cytochrome c biogenesis protein CcmG, thiol:disulfide interchange protein DsbE
MGEAQMEEVKLSKRGLMFGFLLVVMIAAAGFSACGTKSSGSPRVLASEPAVTFKDLQGKDIPLDSFKGKVVLVNFWATWCEPCRSEIPLLIAYQQKYADKGFTMLGVAMDEDGKAAVDPFIQSTKFDVRGQQLAMNYPVVLGNDDIADKFGGLLGLPVTLVISRDGKIVKRYIGSIERNEADLDKQIKDLL